MRTAAKRLSLVRQVERERELADIFAAIERALVDAVAELTRWVDELVEAER